MAELKQYLDLDGLNALWEKIKAADQANQELIQANTDAITEIQSKIEEVETAANDAYDLANNTQSDLSSLTDNVNTLTNDISDLDSKVSSQASEIENLQSRIESVVPDEVVYAEISKDSTGNYTTNRGDRSALSSTVVNALNELNDSFKSINFSDYYTKNEANDTFVQIGDIFSEEEILGIFKN